MTSLSIKACCADLYASDLARLVLGDSFHPGGIELTQRLGVLLGLGSEGRVLDLASGRGASALHLAGRFGCQVVGVDYSTANVSAAREAAERDGLTARLHFQEGDAEHLPDFADASFDAVLCECAFCTFPDKPAAIREIARVLRPGGRFGLSDLIRRRPLPADLQGPLAWIACIADALPVEGYVAECEAAGLVVEHVEEDDGVLAELVREIRSRLFGAHLLVCLKQLELPGIDWPRLTGDQERLRRQLLGTEVHDDIAVGGAAHPVYSGCQFQQHAFML
ncbi:MAG TPA: methyltransferase domain-containing protein [Chloroflexota bacterium]|nr:methyltransferase domain-containing protein [Chloroflexota bacterium]